MRNIPFVALFFIACLIPAYSQQPDLSVDSVLILGGISNQIKPDGFVRKLSSAEIYDPQFGVFTRVGWMREGRVGHTATLLRDGRVLVTGGDDRSTNYPTSSAEIFDPNRGVSLRVGNMHVPRVGHTATLLHDGTVLITGGQDPNFVNTKTAELFDPATLEFTLTGEMHVERTSHTATLLRNGKVLIAGGVGGIGSDHTGELYDPVTHKFTHTGPMVHGRWLATSTLLVDGRVLIAGGVAVIGNSGFPTSSAEIYDPLTKRFASAGDMQSARYGHIAVLLRNGAVLITGGFGHAHSEPDGLLNSAELFHPGRLAFEPIRNMTLVRFNHAATLLSSGQVSITGGFTTGLNDNFRITNTTELYEPKTRSFQASGAMKTARASHSATRLCSQR